MADQTLDYYRQEQGLSRQDLAMLGLKLLGIYALLQVVRYLDFFGVFVINPGALFGPGQQWMAAAYVFPMAGYAMAGAFLLSPYAQRLARWMLPGDGLAIGAGSLSAKDIHVVALWLIGVILVVWSLPELIGAAAGWIDVAQRMGTWRGGPEKTWLIAPAVRLVLGVILMLQDNGLARLWQIMRFGGTGISEARDKR